MLLSALALRTVAAVRPFLHGDELHIYQIAAQGNAADVARASQRTAHPPLFFEALHFWLRAGESEVFLRFFSVLCGTAAVGVLYLWIRNLFGAPAALAASVLAAVTPQLLLLSAQVRGYAVVHLLVLCAFYFQDRFFRSRRWTDLGSAGLAMAGAILTEHCAIFAAAALGAVALLGIARGRLSRRQLAAWAAVQVGLLALLSAVNAAQIASLRGGGLEKVAQTVWLSASYHDPSRESAARFVLAQSAQVVLDYTGARFAKPLAKGSARRQLGFLLGMIAVFLAVTHRRIRSAGFADAAVAAGVVFSLFAAAGVTRFYPYGPTRHDSLLILFLLPLMGLACAELARDRHAGVAAIAAILAIYVAQGTGFRQVVSPAFGNTVEAMRIATRIARQDIPQGATVFADLAGAMQLGYYLDRNAVPDIVAGEPVTLAGLVLLPAPEGFFTFAGVPAVFARATERARAENGLEPPYWVFIGGTPRLSPKLAGVSRLHAFGPRLEFFEYLGHPPSERPAEASATTSR